MSRLIKLTGQEHYFAEFRERYVPISYVFRFSFLALVWIGPALVVELRQTQSLQKPMNQSMPDLGSVMFAAARFNH